MEALTASSQSVRKVIFIDELPWMDTPRSKLLMSLDAFWNSWASARDDIVLVVCGSATSWIIGNIVKNRGGLHNRLTGQIRLEPFSLGECEEYVQQSGHVMSREDIAEYYMVFGGVPYYWSLYDPGASVAQNVDRLLFSPDGELRLEYSQLYTSLFKNAATHLAVVDALASAKAGMSRYDLAKACKVSPGGRFYATLEELEECGFIRSFKEPGRKTRGTMFQLMDNFTLFHHRFMGGNEFGDTNFWANSLNTPAVNTWKGLAFERLCFSHISQIRKALGISGVLSGVYSWRHVPDDVNPSGVQIDMLIDRADNIVDICEMKWSSSPFSITREYAEKLRLKASVFSTVTKTKKGVHLVLVASSGLDMGPYRNVVQAVVTLDDLFE